MPDFPRFPYLAAIFKPYFPRRSHEELGWAGSDFELLAKKTTYRYKYIFFNPYVTSFINLWKI